MTLHLDCKSVLLGHFLALSRNDGRCCLSLLDYSAEETLMPHVLSNYA